MNPTPDQITALNRAIAEYCESIEKYSAIETKECPECNTVEISAKKYTSDLNAIVAVVREWYGNGENKRWFMEYLHGGVAYVSLANMYLINDWKTYTAKNESLALALCLAFAQAAGLKGWE